jgi:hypothetical protein
VPEDPSFREGVSLWVWDDEGRWCLPRIGVEATGRTWATSFETALCVADPAGRLLLAFGDGTPLPVGDDRGRPRVLGTSALRFECVEPFVRWRVEAEGRAVSLDAEDYVTGGVPKPRPGSGHPEAEVRLDLDAEMVAPPWFQGTHEPQGHQVVGERRFEQLARVTGTIAVDGAASSFAGGGLRVHRTGGDRSDYGDFHGHCWQSARFPSGRAFGYIHYRSGPDGAPRYHEGWVLDGDEVMPARVVDPPWMAAVRPAGEEVSFTLRSAVGEVRIEGQTHASSFRPPRRTDADTTFPLLHSGIARYRWGDEEAFGMVERSAHLELRVALD